MRNRSTRTHKGGEAFKLSIDEDSKTFSIVKVPTWAGEEVEDVRVKVSALLSKGFRWDAPGENTSDYDDIVAVMRGLEMHRYPKQAQQYPGEDGKGKSHNPRTNWDSIRARHPGRMIPGDPTKRQTRNRYEPTS